jgi:two-component system, NtrC family, response regulator AtoC
LLHHLMHQLARHYGLPPREFSPGALSACQQHSWPGNLKEMENFVKRYLLAGDRDLTFTDAGFVNGSNGRHISDASLQTSPHVSGDIADQDRPSPKSLKSLIQSVKSEAERNAIGTALQKTGWNRKAAARLLQVSYRTLLYKIDQYHMHDAESFMSPLSAGNFPLNGNSSKGNGKAS